MSTYIVLIFLVEMWQTDVIAASVTGYIVGIVVNYALNYGFTFRSEQRHIILAPKFLIVMVIGLLLNTGVMWTGVNWLGIHYVLAQLVGVTIVLTWSFTANRLWVFTG